MKVYTRISVYTDRLKDNNIKNGEIRGGHKATGAYYCLFLVHIAIKIISS
jgi:hypothetical protein